jgi:NADPH2:quinone reductase
MPPAVSRFRRTSKAEDYSQSRKSNKGEKMLSVVVKKGMDTTFMLEEVGEPIPGPHEAIVSVEAVSLNLGEVRLGIMQMTAGTRPGWDFAGTVERSAADGSGPEVGTRVVGFT